MPDKVLGWAILTSLTLYWPNESLAKFNMVFFQFFTMSYVIASGFSDKRRSVGDDIAVVVGLFFLAGVVNVIATQFQIIPIACFFNLALALGLIVLISAFTGQEKTVKKFIVAAAVINCLYLVVQKFGWNPAINSQVTTREEGALLGNAANLSSFLALALPFAVSASWLAWPLFFLIGVIQHENGLVLVCLVYAAVKKPNTIYLMLPVMLAFMFDRWREIIQTSFGAKLDIWRCTIEQTFMSPWHGWGLGNKPLVTSQIHNIVNQKPDFVYSSILQFVFSTGLAGAVAIGAAVRLFFKNFRPDDADMSLLGLLILSVFKYPVEIQRLWLLICAVIALWIVSQQKRRIAPCG